MANKAQVSMIVAMLCLLTAFWGFGTRSPAQNPLTTRNIDAKSDPSWSKNADDVQKEMQQLKEKRDQESALARANWHKTILQPATIKIVCTDDEEFGATLHLGPMGEVVNRMRAMGFFHPDWEAEARKRLSPVVDNNYHLSKWFVKVSSVSDIENGNQKVEIWLFPHFRHADFDIGEVDFNPVRETWTITKDGTTVRTKTEVREGISPFNTGSKPVPMNLNVK